jgi:hypothetical protein
VNDINIPRPNDPLSPIDDSFLTKTKAFFGIDSTVSPTREDENPFRFLETARSDGRYPEGMVLLISDNCGPGHIAKLNNTNNIG